MNTIKISPQVDTAHINKRFNEFNCSICEQLKLALDNINSTLELLDRVRGDKQKKRIALDFIEENSHMQSILLDELLNGRRACEASSQSLLGLAGEIRFAINTISSWSKSLHGNQLDQSTLIQGIEVMGNHARTQNELIDSLQNWILDQNQLYPPVSDRQSNPKHL